MRSLRGAGGGETGPFLSSIGKRSLRVAAGVAAVLALVLATTHLAGCGRREKRPNLIVITADSVRRDLLSAHGADGRFPWKILPSVDDLSREAVVLGECYAIAPRTTQSLGSFMTGLYPSRHRAFGLFHTLGDSAETLAQVLSGQGYRTAAVVTTLSLVAGRGFERGFQTYDDNLVERQLQSAENVVDRIDLLTLEPSKEPLFLWVHLMDLEWPYVPPPELAELVDPGITSSFTVYQDVDSSRISRGQITFGDALSPSDIEHLKRLYLGEARYLDGHIGRMLGILESRGFLENAIVVFYSTHGESMIEHRYRFDHGQDLYEPSTHVPALIRFPARLAAGRFDGLVSSVDFFPTLLDLLSIPVPAGLNGVSFLPAIEGAPPEREVCYLESDYQRIHAENPRFHRRGPAGKWRAVVARGYKLIRIPGDPVAEYELYDLKNDPGETVNLVEERGEVTEALRANLDVWDAIVDEQPGLLEPRDDEISAGLRGMGYIN